MSRGIDLLKWTINENACSARWLWLAALHSLFASLRRLPKNFRRFLYGVGLFGADDFAHSLMILYAVAAFTPKFGAARAATISVGLYALHNILYAGISLSDWRSGRSD